METNFDLESFTLDGLPERKDEHRLINRVSPELQVEQEEPEKTGTFSEAFERTRDDVHVANVLTRMQMETNHIDEDFVNSLSLEKIEQDAKVSNLHDYDLDWLSSAPNPQEYNRRLSRSLEIQATNEAVANVGGLKALAAQMAAYATDPIGFAVDAAAGGSSKVGLLRRFIESGGRAALADLATEAVRLADGEGVDLTEFAVGTLTAFTVGGALGLPGNAKAAKELEALEHKAAKYIEDDLKATNKSAGAAQAEGLPGQLPGDGSNKVTITEELLDRVEDEGLNEPKYQGGRFDFASNAQKSNDVTVRKAMDDFVGVGIQEKGKVREMSAVEESQRLKYKFSETFYNSYGNNLKAYLKNKKGKGFIRRLYAHKDAKEFSEMVGDFMLGKRTDVPDEVKMVAKDTFESFRAVKEYAIASGIPAENFIKGSVYMPRMFGRGKVSAILSKAGLGDHTALKPLIVKAIKNGREAAGLDFDDSITEAVAAAYLDRAWNVGKGGGKFKDLSSIDLDDAEGLLKMVDEFLPEDARATARETILKNVGSKRSKEADKVDRLKGRLLLDTDATMEFNGVQVSVNDLFENDIYSLFNSYVNTMSGELGLRSKGWTTRKMEQFIAEKERSASINEDALKNTGAYSPDDAVPKDVDNLQFAYDRILHKGVSTDNDILDGILRISSNHTYASKMLSAGLNAISEAGTLIAQRGLWGFIKDIPEFTRLIKQYKTGKNVDEMASLIETLTGGAGSSLFENRAAYHVQDNLNVGLQGKLGKAEMISDGFKRIANEVNFLPHITDITTRMSTHINLNYLARMAKGKKMPSWWDARSKAWGLSAENKRLITDYFNSSNVKYGKGGGVLRMDNMDFKTQQAIEQFIFKSNSNNIQKIFAGDLPKMFQNPVGAFIFKFRSFVTAAYMKHTLDDINHMDTLALQKLIYTGGLGMLMYMNRTYLTYGHDKNKLDEKLTMENALRSGATYAVSASLIPDIADSVSNLVLGKPIFGRTRTSGLKAAQQSFDLQEFVSNIPGVVMANDVVKSLDSISTLIRGGELNKDQVKAVASVLMLDTFYLTRGLRQMAVDNAPSARNADSNAVDIWEEFSGVFD